MPLAERLSRIASDHGGVVDEIVSALEHSRRVLSALRTGFEAAFEPHDVRNAAVVVVGSVARGQCTRGSDLDFFTIVTGDGISDATSSQIVEVMLELARAQGLRAPRIGGPAARSVPRTELETIHPFTDDLPRTMRRNALVTTSASVHGEQLRLDVVHGVIDAFLGGERRPPRVRSIVDAFARLARDMNLSSDWVVDHRSPSGEGFAYWGKVRTLYRIELASCLAATFQAEAACAGRSRSELVDELFRRLTRSPLERLLDLHDELEVHERRWLAAVVFAANRMLQILAAEGARDKLIANEGDDETGRLRHEVVETADRLGDALHQLFYKTAVLRPLTERLALFG